MNKTTTINRDHKVANNAFILTAFFFCGFFMIADFSISVTYLVVLLTLMEFLMIFLSRKKTYSIAHSAIPYFFIMLVIIFNLRPNGYIQEQPFYLFSMLIFLFIMGRCEASNSDRDLIITILISTSVFVAIIVFVSRLFPSLYDSTYLRIITSSSREYNHWIMRQGYSGTVGGDIGKTALYIAVGEAFCISRFLMKRHRVDLFLSLFLFVALILVGRRSELLAVSIAFLLTYYGFASGSKKQKIILASVAVLVGLIVLYFLISSNAITYSGKNRIISSIFLLIHGEDITNGRTRLYVAAWESIKQHPLFGIGWGGARTITRTILSNDVNVHNIYIQLLCEVGIFGSLICWIAVLSILKNRYRLFKYYIGTENGKYITAAFFITLYIALLGIFDNPVYHDEFWLLVSILFIMTNRLENNDG